MSPLKFICLALLCLSAVRSEFVLGGCPSYKRSLESFDVSRYAGKWYEIAREKTTPFQNGDCTTAEYTLNADGTLKVLNTQLKTDGNYSSAEGKAFSTNDPFRFKVMFSDTFFGRLFKGDYQVVDTDYESYTVVYSCSELYLAKIQYYWILSRTPHIESEKTAALLKMLSDKLNIPADNFRFTNQEKGFCSR